MSIIFFRLAQGWQQIRQQRIKTLAIGDPRRQQANHSNQPRISGGVGNLHKFAWSLFINFLQYLITEGDQVTFTFNLSLCKGMTILSLIVKKTYASYPASSWLGETNCSQGIYVCKQAGIYVSLKQAAN